MSRGVAGLLAVVLVTAACGSTEPGINLFDTADLGTASAAEIVFPGGVLVTVTSDEDVAALAEPLDEDLTFLVSGRCREQVPVSFFTQQGRVDFVYCRDDAVLTGEQEYWEGPGVAAPEGFVAEFEALAAIVPGS